MAQTGKLAADQRKAKLDEIERQIASGSLTVRQMTANERKLHPPRPATPRKRRSY